jgi:hypothetical protein
MGTARSRGAARGTIAGLLAVIVGGCLRQPIEPLSPQPTASHGEVSFRALADISAPGPRNSRTEELVPPVPMPGNKAPEYPGTALAAGEGPVTVVVRVIIGTAGRIEQIMNSPLMESTASAYSADFKSAVEAAVGRWLFSPAQWRVLEEGEDLDADGKTDYRKVVSSTAIRVYLDLQFDFRVVNGKGVVASP